MKDHKTPPCTPEIPCPPGAPSRLWLLVPSGWERGRTRGRCGSQAGPARARAPAQCRELRRMPGICRAFIAKRRLGFSPLQENAGLFKADKSSQTWLDYVGHLDGIVLDGLFRLVHKSLQLLLTNMAPDVGPGSPRHVVAEFVSHRSPFGGQTHPSQCSPLHVGGECQRCRCPPCPCGGGTRGLGRARAGHEARVLLTSFRLLWPPCSRCAWSCATAECGTDPRWRWERRTASWSWWRACSETSTRPRRACLGCWRGT